MKPQSAISIASLAFVLVLGFSLNPSTVFATGPTYDGGDGSSGTPYLISTCVQLQGISQDAAHLAAHYKLTQNVDCSATSDSNTGDPSYDATLYNSGAGFVPIGTPAHPFSGGITGTKTNIDDDGNYWSINGLSIVRPTTEDVGLFASATSATIGDLAVHGAVTGKDNVGLLAGYIDTSTVHGIDASNGSLVGTTNVGGMIGRVGNNTTISHSHSSGTIAGGTSGSPLVTNSGNFGGLVGESDDTTTYLDNHSSSNISIFSKNSVLTEVGGLLGSLCDGQFHCTLNNSSATGDISIHATTDNANQSQIQTIGGLAGYASGAIGSSPDPDFTENYATGNISIVIAENQSANSQNVSQIGGLFGASDNSEQKQSFASGSITIDALNVDVIGGFIGESDGGTDFSDDYSSGAINLTARSSDSDTIGGFIGYLGNVLLERVYSSSVLTLNVASTGFYQKVGGLVGELNGTITDSFEAGSISAPTGSSATFGGLVGLYNQTDFTFLSNDFYYQVPGSGAAVCLGSDTGNNVSITSHCTGIDSTTVPVSHFYDKTNPPMSTSWNFNTVWLQHANTFPTLRVFATDTTPPVITLIGSASITVTKGDIYTDQGATASDNVDGNITSSIVKTGTVDTNTVGTYTINYNVTDSSGNAAIQVTRSVTVASPAATTTNSQGSSSHGVSGQIIKSSSGRSGSVSGQSLIAMLKAEIAALEAQLVILLEQQVSESTSVTPH